jgi:hypothetical protein
MTDPLYEYGYLLKFLETLEEHFAEGNNRMRILLFSKHSDNEVNIVEPPDGGAYFLDSLVPQIRQAFDKMIMIEYHLKMLKQLNGQE